MTIKIITDGASDLPLSYIEDNDIKVVPLNVSFGEQTYKTGIEIDNKTFYQMMREAEELPKSSCPSPYEFLEAYKDVPETEDIIVFCLSKSLSGTYESALIAKDMLLEEQPTRKIEVLNTKTGSCGQILHIDEAIKLIKSGASFDEVVDNEKKLIDNTNTFILLETLENVIKGGRLSKTKAAIANALNIKLILGVSKEGAIEVREKARGDKKVLRRFIEQIGEYGKDLEQKVLTMTHSNCEEKALKILNEIKDKYKFKETILSEMGPLIGTYAGEGGIVIAFKAM
ncbi:DegV family protein [Calidifontibacillus oryziterrae]|uniref:DegV family protein n=1 Tax=Calidifontibacillus oryziterrae TaxID=1191699 RepID=UPI000319BDA2|nr:DegV family protein [Calidifontibacillus oryziterrae]